jgi:CheY-like chemotaxis protein
MKKILVIEDNTDIRENVAEILELEAYEVSTAENGERGIEIALQTKPDLILCDIRMPELDGYDVLQFVLRHETLQHTPLVFLTSTSEKEDIRNALALGIAGYMVKPFEPEDLLLIVNGYSARHATKSSPIDVDFLIRLLPVFEIEPDTYTKTDQKYNKCCIIHQRFIETNSCQFQQKKMNV